MLTFLRILVSFIFLVIIVKLNRRRKIQKEISDWQIDDILIIKEKEKYAILKGWCIKKIVVEFDGTDYYTEVNMADVKLNKSAYWRRLHDYCMDTMGTKPKFNAKVTLWYSKDENEDTPKKGSTQIHGKPIHLLNETECQIYLKECIDREDYETAELIKKQMEKYR